MARGALAPLGSTRVSANGYHYTKAIDPATNKECWRLTHHILAEKKLGRPLREDERVHFVGSKSNLSFDNIKIVERGRGSLRRRKAQIEARIAELQAELDEINKELVGPAKINRN